MNAAPERKAHPRTRLPRRHATRRWCIPPAIEREPNEILESAHILDEVPGQVGLVLWQSLRDVTLWASIPAGRRDGLFAADAARDRLQLLITSGAEPVLEVSLTTLAAMVGNPEAAGEEIVSLVCLQVSRWAEARGAFSTSIGYAQAAALASPEDPSAALSVGSLALRWRRLTRAETWFRRTIGLARRSRQWEPYALAYVELGSLYTRRGDPATAERYFVQGLRAARRHGLIATRGAALHGLLLLALEAGRLDQAERYARGAMRAYGRGHPRLPELVHDVAYLWVSRDNPSRAIPMLQKLLPGRVEPLERAFTLAVLARAAAGVGDVRLYQESWGDAWALIRRRAGEESQHARALLELTRASARMKDWHHMEEAARLAVAAAAQRNEPRIAAAVEELAATVRRGSRGKD